MSRYYYDLHVHSCLSPCGDKDMTPNNIANMAALVGLNIVALTDHNSCKNCPAFFKAARRAGIVPVAGMELTTAEEIHLVCLFEHLEEAMDFDQVIEPHRAHLPNKAQIFGDQPILDEQDNPIGEDPWLLPMATDITLEEAVALVERCGGICHPAHIDRESNGIIAVLGALPDQPTFSRVEFNDPSNIEPYCERFPSLRKAKILSCSDAHYLWNLREENDFFDLDDEPYSSDRIRQQLFSALRGDIG